MAYQAQTAEPGLDYRPKVLFVDDDPTQLLILEEGLKVVNPELRALTHLVRSKGDIPGLVNRLAKKKYGAIVYDTEMGELEGPQVAVEVAQSSGNHAPYVGWSRQTDHDKERKWEEAGAEGFWEKVFGFDPSGYHGLVKRIESLIDREG